MSDAIHEAQDHFAVSLARTKLAIRVRLARARSQNGFLAAVRAEHTKC